jgi:hypothetical protein
MERAPGKEDPRVSHAVLEECARATWDFIFHSIDFPLGWRVRWGQLDDTLLGLAGGLEVCAARQRGAVLGLCVFNEKLILLDEENQRGRPARAVVQTIVHELIHANVRNTVHGDQFQRALRSAMAFYDGTSDAPTPAPSFAGALAQPAHPMPRTGVRFPFYDPGLEYRG